MAIDREKSFWLSYSDLMTSLFFIMLVLFVVSISIVFSQKNQVEKLTNELGELKVTTEQYKNILQLEKQFKTLSNSSRLRYDEEHKTFVAKDLEGIEIFNSEKHTIKVEYLETVDKIGRDLEQLLKLLHKNNPNNQFLLVIEGNSANNYKKSFCACFCGTARSGATTTMRSTVSPLICLSSLCVNAQTTKPTLAVRCSAVFISRIPYRRVRV